MQFKSWNFPINNWRITKDNNENSYIYMYSQNVGFLNWEFTAVSLILKWLCIKKYGLINDSNDHGAHYFHHLSFKQGRSAKENEGQGFLENQNTGRLQQNSESRLIPLLCNCLLVYIDNWMDCVDYNSFMLWSCWIV